MVIENKEKKSRIGLIILGIIIVILIIVIFVLGVKGIVKILSSIGILIIVAVFIGLIVYFVWFVFFKKQRFDPVYVNKQKLIRSGKMNLPRGMLGDLYLSGDSGHSRVKLGKISGYNRIQIPVRKIIYEETTDEKTGKKIKKIKMKNKKTPYDEELPEYQFGKEEQDVFIIKRSPLHGIVIDPLVIRVSPDEHTSLVGDIILKGFSLVPISEYFFLNSSYLDRKKIDWTIDQESTREIMFENMRDYKSIVDRAIGLDADHKKNIENKNLVEMPNQPTQRI